MALTQAKRLASLAPSATLAMSAKAAQLRAAGQRVFDFGVGEPDFPTPPHVIEAAHRAALAGQTRYTPVSGLLSLKKAICEASGRDRGWQPTPDMVVVSAGAKQSLFNVAAALFEEGDEVVVLSPYWVSYPEQVRLFGAVPVCPPTVEEEGFRLSPAALAAAITDRTKALILNSPSNPSGSAYAPEQLLALAEVLRDRPLWVVVDEIYGQLVYDGFEQRSLAALAPFLRDRLVVVDGVSKTHCMTGWRIGWSLSPPGLARALDAVQSQSTSNPSSVAQAAAEAALRGPRDALDAMREAYARRRRLMAGELEARAGLRGRLPEGAFYLFVDVRGLFGRSWQGGTLRSDEDVCAFLLEQARVVTVPGSAFGSPGYLRFSYAVAEDDIRQGVEALGTALAGLSPA